MVETETYSIHRSAFIYQPVAAPHQSFLPIGSEVPLAKKSSFPPGEAKRRIAVGGSLIISRDSLLQGVRQDCGGTAAAGGFYPPLQSKTKASLE